MHSFKVRHHTFIDKMSSQKMTNYTSSILHQHWRIWTQSHCAPHFMPQNVSLVWTTQLTVSLSRRRSDIRTNKITLHQWAEHEVISSVDKRQSIDQKINQKTAYIAIHYTMSLLLSSLLFIIHSKWPKYVRQRSFSRLMTSTLKRRHWKNKSRVHCISPYIIP